nr:MAG TPA: hypothetical protein [Caudoviricetes sp.]
MLVNLQNNTEYTFLIFCLSLISIGENSVFKIII